MQQEQGKKEGLRDKPFVIKCHHGLQVHVILFCWFSELLRYEPALADKLRCHLSVGSRPVIFYNMSVVLQIVRSKWQRELYLQMTPRHRPIRKGETVMVRGILATSRGKGLLHM